MLSHLASRTKSTAIALTIAGSDSGAGAGIQVDLLTFAAHGVYGTTAITCLTAQNPQGVSAVQAAPASFVIEQCEQVCRYYAPSTLKTGMLFNQEIVAAVADFIRKNKIPAVVDPVMVATSGATLLTEEAVSALKSQLIPLAAVVTPNLDEATLLLGRPVQGGDHCEAEALALAQIYRVPFLLKGGHGHGQVLVDTLAWPDGRTAKFTASRIEKIDTHGSGCTLSAAITARLALGEDLLTAVQTAHSYLQKGMHHPLFVGGANQIRH
jgi:hydroxymethylpyrimidine/phosphomethylpyrimidine kinase